jgi:predicted acetyltransferase
MSFSTTIKPSQSSILEPMNLHNPIEFNELLRQRILCGWDKTVSQLEAWREQADTYTISMFWIVLNEIEKIEAPKRFVGHIGMTSKTDDKRKPVQHICNLFILTEHRRGGLGQGAVRSLEAWAKVDPECKAITLNALSKRYIEEDVERPFYARVCESLDIEMPKKGTSNENWYARLGYVKWKEERLYPVVLDGERILLWAAWLRKELV